MSIQAVPDEIVGNVFSFQPEASNSNLVVGSILNDFISLHIVLVASALVLRVINWILLFFRVAESYRFFSKLNAPSLSWQLDF